MAHYVDIKDNPNLARDINSMGVVNTNNAAYEAAKRRHQEAMARVAEQERRNAELNMLRKEVDELKALVTALLRSAENKNGLV